MATVGEEYYLRSSLILLKGSLFIARKVLIREEQKEIQKSGRDLVTLLNDNRRGLEHEFRHSKQREKLYPAGGITDIGHWDISLLTGVLQILFRSSLSANEKRALRTIKHIRNEVYAHRATAELSVDDYTDICTDLKEAFTNLAAQFEPEVENECNEMRRECMHGSLDMKSHVENLKRVSDTDGMFRDILEKIDASGKQTVKIVKNILTNEHSVLKTDIHAEISNSTKEICRTLRDEHITKTDLFAAVKEAIQNTSQEQRCKRKIKVVESELEVYGEDEDQRNIELVEQIIKTVINEAIRRQVTSEELIDIRIAIQDILDEIASKAGVQAIEAKTGCVIISFDSMTFEQLLNLFNCLESGYIKQRLNKLAIVFSRHLHMKEQIRLYLSISSKTLQSIFDELEKDPLIENKRSIQIPIQFDSIEGIAHVLDLFENDGLTNSVNKLSEALSSKVGTKIKLKSSVNVSQLKEALDEYVHTGENTDTQTVKFDDIYSLEKAPDEGEIEESAIDTPICERYLTGDCERRQCESLHCKIHLPYQWQVKLYGTWKNLKEMEMIEHAFSCNEEFSDEVRVEHNGLEFAIVVVLRPQIRAVFVVVGLHEGGTNADARRLSTISYKKEDDNSESFKTQWRWYWMDDNNKTQRFEPDAMQHTLEAKFLANQVEYRYTRENDRYILDFNDMSLWNIDYRRRRRIIRRPVFVSLEDVKGRHYPRSLTAAPVIETPLPNSWVPWDLTSPFELVQIYACDPKYAQIYATFFETMDEEKIEIDAIFRLQNHNLWSLYCKQHDTIELHLKRLGMDTAVDTRYFFHGTDSWDAVHNICINHFDVEICSSTCEDDAYFTKDAKYSHLNTKGPDRLMFMVTVLARQNIKGPENYRLPPNEPDGDQELRDSFVNDNKNPSIFYVFDKKHCYPEYLIQYRNHLPISQHHSELLDDHMEAFQTTVEVLLKQSALYPISRVGKSASRNIGIEGRTRPWSKRENTIASEGVPNSGIVSYPIDKPVAEKLKPSPATSVFEKQAGLTRLWSKRENTIASEGVPNSGIVSYPIVKPVAEKLKPSPATSVFEKQGKHPSRQYSTRMLDFDIENSEDT